jgi:hypothetical protein
VAGASDIEDPEGSPALPSGSLAATAVPAEILPAARVADTGAEIWRLAWPVMASLALVTAVSLVDIAMVGRLGANAVAAVGYATQFFFLSQSVLFAVGFACVALMARATAGWVGSGRSRRWSTSRCPT